MRTTTNGDPLVIVGAGTAGLTVAEAARRFGHNGEIILIGEEPSLPYDRPPLSKAFLQGSSSESELLLRPEKHFADLGIQTRLGCHVADLDVNGRSVTLEDRSLLRYSDLVIATGVTPKRLAGTLSASFTVRTIEDARALAGSVEIAGAVAVIGGGFLAYEIAASLRDLGMGVSVIDRSLKPLESKLGTLAARKVISLHMTHGVDVRAGRQVVDATATGVHDRTLTLDDGAEIDVRLVVVAIGSTPNVDWIRSSSLDLRDGVCCDDFGLAAPHVYAVGDVARWGGPSGLREENRSNAAEQALTVAERIVFGNLRVPSPSYFWTDQYDTKVQVAGRVSSAELEIVAGEPESDRFVGVWRQSGAVIGVLGMGMPKDFAKARRDLTLRESLAVVHRL